MRADFPYKTQPCIHCRNNGRFCDWCLGTGREVKRIEEAKRDYFELLFVLIVVLTVLAILGASR